MRVLAGWGRSAPSAAEVRRPADAAAVQAVIDEAAATGRRVLPRGLGRSYGDAAQCAGGLVLDMTGLDRLHEVDPVAGTVRCDAGVALDTLMRVLVPQGWFVPVTPGTRYVTVGGALAADVHGKNHHRDGSFAAHVDRVALATPTGAVEVGPAQDPDVFWATAGGMGLTGVATEATIRMLRAPSAYVLVDTERASNLDDLMGRMAARDDEYRYSVAWIDCLARGRHLGRGVLTRGDHAAEDDLPPRLRRTARAFDPRMPIDVPVTPPPGLLNPLTVAAFNEAWFRAAPKHRTGHPEHLTTFFHPLDGIGGWNRLYGRSGFVQYQLAVPFGAEDCIRAVVERFRRHRVASFLGVLKRFGPGDPGPLSFPAPGWTLALDLPIGPPTLGPLLDELDELVVAAGGRVYLAKDGRLRPDVLAAMYPNLDQWRAVRARVDPNGLLDSDLARRLGLVPSPSGPARR
ncbi:MAG: FAD-binding oxidoreductase, partial [Actinomycetota bacterium]|nr:FAD-binding oxidoreductase [Actinomycetota bacterium]